jgi:RND family efflux transporter MFP subunit
MNNKFTFLDGGLFAALIFFGCQEEAPQKETIRSVKAMKVADHGTFTDTRFPGIARATKEVDLSFRVSGPMITRPVNIGDEVKAGTTVARIDPRDYEINLRTVQGQLVRAQAVLQRAQADLERVLNIQKQDPGAVSQTLVDKNLPMRDSTREDVKSLVAAVDQAKDLLNYTYLKAPFDGIITKTYAEAFEDVRAKQPVLRLLDPSKVEMWINIPESMISLLPYISDIGVRFDALGIEAPAEVKEVGTEASQTTRTFPINLIMEQPKDAKILPGMAGSAFGDVNLPDKPEESEYIIPVSAVFTGTDSKSYVWSIDESTMTVKRHEVTPGRLTGQGLNVKGLQTGQWIATAGIKTLRVDQKVTILQPGKQI